MKNSLQTVVDLIESRCAQFEPSIDVSLEEITVTVPVDHLLAFCEFLQSDPALSFEELIDLCAVDYMGYEGDRQGEKRFSVVYHLLSVSHNARVRVRVFPDESNLRVPSVISVWACANWYEREAFDLYGVLFEGHPDLRRLLTDYGFIGHPFRKDFPLIGNVEMRYDPEKGRVVYEPVSIEPRILTPRVVRDDSRYEGRDG